MEIQNNDWTKQLLDQKNEESNPFPSEFYDSILTIRARLERKKLGTWSTCKERGADTFTVKRTS